MIRKVFAISRIEKDKKSAVDELKSGLEDDENVNENKSVSDSKVIESAELIKTDTPSEDGHIISGDPLKKSIGTPVK